MSGSPLRPTPPRGLILLASAWLIVAWAIHIGLRPPVQMHAASYTPGVRMLLLSVTIGICIAWPLLRLSGPPRAWPIRQALLDLVVLACLAQVAVWPLRLVTPWPPMRSAAIDACLLLWGLAVAAPVALGTRPWERGATLMRSACMLIAVLFVGLVPIAALLAGRTPAIAMRSPPAIESAWWTEAAWSPLTAIHALSGGGADAPGPHEWTLALAGGGVATIAWLATALLLAIPVRAAARPAAGDEDQAGLS